MYCRPILVTLLAVLLLSGLVPARLARADDEDTDAAMREEARRSILIEWSKEANTRKLALGPAATQLTDLWLDYCRSRFLKRQKPSRQFTGVPHHVWFEEDGRLVLAAMFVNVELARAAMEPRDVPRLLAAVARKDFSEVVGVPGDPEQGVRLWGVMLATEAAAQLHDRPEARSVQAAWTKASYDLFSRLVETFFETPALPDRHPRPGTPGAARLVWLDAIAAAGLDKAGPTLADIHAKLVEQGLGRDAAAAARVLAGCAGAAAEAFVKTELTSGEAERQRAVLGGIGPWTGPDALRKAAELAHSSESDQLARFALAALQRAGADRSAQADHVARLLRQLFSRLDDTAPRKLDAAIAVVGVGHATERAVAYLRAQLEALEAAEAPLPRIAFVQRALERAEAQLAEGGG